MNSSIPVHCSLTMCSIKLFIIIYYYYYYYYYYYFCAVLEMMKMDYQVIRHEFAFVERQTRNTVRYVN